MFAFMRVEGFLYPPALWRILKLERRPHFEQCPEITMPLASLLTTYILGLSAIPTVSHSSDPIDTPVDFKLHHYQFVQYIETHHVLEEYKRLSFFWLSSLTWGKSNPHPVLPSWCLFLDVHTSFKCAPSSMEMR